MSTASNGDKVATLEPATLADITSDLRINHRDTTLDSTRLVAVVVPARAGISASIGGRPLQPGRAIAMTQVPMGISVFTGEPAAQRQEITTTSDIKVKVNFELARSEDEPSRLKPYGTRGTLTASLNATLSNLRLFNEIDFSGNGLGVGLPTSLSKLDLRLKGNLEATLSLSGGGEGVVGYYSKAWKEVEDATVGALGVKAKYTGISSRDKVGKFPVAGFVFSVPCAATVTCPVTTGSTQTPLRLASAMGVIVWLNMDLSGRLTLDGETGVRLSGTEFNIGLTKADSGPVTTVSDLRKTSDKNLLEAPFVDGDIGIEARAGVSVDVDMFALGVRIANTSAFFGTQLNVDGEGRFVNAWPDFGRNWQITRTGCFSRRIGGGVIGRFQLGLGFSVQAGAANASAGFNYSWETPNDTERQSDGWVAQKLTNIPIWYSEREACAPEIKSFDEGQSTAGYFSQFKVSGRHLDAESFEIDAPNCQDSIFVVLSTPREYVFECRPGWPGIWRLDVRRKAPALTGLASFQVTSQLPTALNFPPIDEGTCRREEHVRSPTHRTDNISCSPTQASDRPRALTMWMSGTSNWNKFTLDAGSFYCDNNSRCIEWGAGKEGTAVSATFFAQPDRVENQGGSAIRYSVLEHSTQGFTPIYQKSIQFAWQSIMGQQLSVFEVSSRGAISLRRVRVDIYVSEYENILSSDGRYHRTLVRSRLVQCTKFDASANQKAHPDNLLEEQQYVPKYERRVTPIGLSECPTIADIKAIHPFEVSHVPERLRQAP